MAALGFVALATSIAIFERRQMLLTRSLEDVLKSLGTPVFPDATTAVPFTERVLSALSDLGHFRWYPPVGGAAGADLS